MNLIRIRKEQIDIINGFKVSSNPLYCLIVIALVTASPPTRLYQLVKVYACRRIFARFLIVAVIHIVIEIRAVAVTVFSPTARQLPVLARTVNLSRQEILNGYMRPYQQAAFAGAGSYMSSFNEFEGIPATMNRYLMDELLRQEWGFDGFIVSDATAVVEEVAHGIGDLQEVSARSLQAGLDMDMNSDGFVNTLKKSVDEGRITIRDIDRA